MLISTQAIVLHTSPYSETSMISNIFTRELGLKSYISKGIRNTKGGGKMGLLQPMNSLNMVVYNTPRHNINHIKEMQLQQPSPLMIHPTYSSLVFFMNEVLYKALKADEPNQPLFDYVNSTLGHLQQNNRQDLPYPHSTTMLPLSFLIHTAKHLGIEPLDNYSTHEPLFNIAEGRFQAPPSQTYLALHPQSRFFSANQSLALHELLTAIHHHTALPLLNLEQRTTLIDLLIEYYHTHLPSFSHFQSHHILHDVLQ